MMYKQNEKYKGLICQSTTASKQGMVVLVSMLNLTISFYCRWIIDRKKLFTDYQIRIEFWSRDWSYLMSRIVFLNTRSVRDIPARSHYGIADTLSYFLFYFTFFFALYLLNHRLHSFHPQITFYNPILPNISIYFSLYI